MSSMFRTDNIDDKKTEWGFSDTPIVLSVGEGESLPNIPNEIVSSVNILPEDEDQKSPAENLEHRFVVGLNKNIFEQHNGKTDLIIIQNPDGYSLSFVNQNKTEPLWADLGLKDKSKEWAQDNAILEVKDILIYDEKAHERVYLEDLESESKSFVSKLREDPQTEEIVEEQKNEKDFQLIINYIPEYMISSKEITENCESVDGSIKAVENEIICKRTVNDNDHLKVSSNSFIDLKVDNNVHKTEFSEITTKNKFLPEKNLPLKKKTKMKKSISFMDNQRSLLKQNLFKNRQSHGKSSIKSEIKEQQSEVKQDCDGSNSEKSFFNKINTRKPLIISDKLQKVKPDLLTQENKDEPLKSEKKSLDFDLRGFDITKFKSIYDLVEGLRKYRMISVPIWQMLNTGLREMNVDILKEIIKKRKKPGSGNYSPQLKAFALVVYFKQPVAFNFLAKVYKSGWPSLNVIKEWKLQLNNHQRPNFVGVQRKTENVA